MINVKNKFWIICIFFVIIVGIGIFLYFNNTKKQSSNYQSSKTSSNSTTSNTITTNSENNTPNNSKQNSTTEAPNESQNQSQPQFQNESQEILITSFSTKIYNKENARQNNIEITCNTLNNTIVKNNSTFSFCNTIGPSTSAKGYQEADIFDKDRK